ncbi:MAG TPA: polysaccharide biosynthesis/export family protein [Pirellulales bacterium]|jgi:polysaccharide export outer membrane protein|nr:polysaccharide biosynthesis/export family protein [Pirellulales bacterium]
MKLTLSSPEQTASDDRGPTSILKRCRRSCVALGACASILAGLCLGAARIESGRPSPPGSARVVASVAPAEVLHDQPLAEALDPRVVLCQMLSPADPNPIPAVDCTRDGPGCSPNWWKALGPVEGFQEYAQGEYVGRARLQHVPLYRLRVDDVMDFVFRVTRDEIPSAYEINVGDEVTIESATDLNLKRALIVLSDGTITLPLLGQVRAAELTVQQLREELERLYARYYKVPAITVTPTKVDTQLEDLRYTVGGRSGFGGQVRSGKVTPEGTVQLPAVGSVPAQGLTLDEFRMEVAERFAEKVQGIEVMPVLTVRAPRFVYVLGEVKTPGRFDLVAPTTIMQALAMAGSWNNGANIKQIVVFRRADDWRLIATILDLRAALLGRRPCPATEIWVSDADLIIVPKSNILRTDNIIELVFTKGLYAVAPFSGSLTFTNLTTLTH